MVGLVGGGAEGKHRNVSKGVIIDKKLDINLLSLVLNILPPRYQLPEVVSN